MPARPVARALVLGALGTAAAIGCSLDWNVRPDPRDASSSDAPDDGADRGTPLDATDDEGSVDVTPADGGQCEALLSDVVDKRKKARLCELASGQCAEKQMDLCCEVFVAKRDSGAADAFAKAVAAFHGAGCDAGCIGCPGGPVIGGCVLKGGEYLCDP